MGDDLHFAQRFTRTAADGLALIAQMDDPRGNPEAGTVIDMMVTLQRGAKRLRARHIYSGAQNVLSAMHHEDNATLSGRIENLGYVVTEYARGVEEMLHTTHLPEVLTPKDKWETARETLNELLPTAPPETADMLSRLMRAPMTLKTVQPDLAIHTDEANIVQFAEINKTMPEEIALAESLSDAFRLEPETDSQEPVEPAPTRPEISHADHAITVTLDAMMRDVIADALSVARSVGRTISLSYDMGERIISETRALELRSRLSKTLSQIIRQSITDDRVGHIDINLAGEQLHIMAGTTAIRVAIDPKDSPKAKTLITPETEQGLRDQLNALMDPISLHETAS